ncbi:MAG: RNA-binding S4 domain-containing protein [bacterium]
MEEIFKLKSDYIELIKLLKATGHCSTGGEAKQAVTEGLIKVDGQTEMRKKCKIRRGQVVTFQGDTIQVS